MYVCMYVCLYVCMYIYVYIIYTITSMFAYYIFSDLKTFSDDNYIQLPCDFSRDEINRKIYGWGFSRMWINMLPEVVWGCFKQLFIIQYYICIDMYVYNDSIWIGIACKGDNSNRPTWKKEHCSPKCQNPRVYHQQITAPSFTYQKLGYCIVTNSGLFSPPCKGSGTAVIGC